ncbi:MAG: hypothetical protein GC162_07990 [Planctomycetes bacterium]|nr:hypothetical protein [Planctomycetota bacterium]
MKYIIAVIQPERTHDVLAELEARGIHLVTTSNVKGRGRQKGLSHQYRGLKVTSTLIDKVKLEIAVNDEYLETAIEGIETAACTEQIGDGKIFVMDLEQCVRIRTAERGSAAIG